MKKFLTPALIVTILFLILGLAVAGLLHGFNMFHYPYFENDEGTYLGQGYAVAFQGKLANYTYWYDHAPVGWFFVAAWLRLTGGPFAFGYSLFSGRLFMLIVHLASSALVFLIAKKLTKKNWAAFLAVLIFSLSPLGIYFQRRLLLDNIMTFWLLCTISILINAKERLHLVMAAGVTLMLSALSKETVIFAVPGFLLLAFQSLNKRQRLIGLTTFVLPLILGLGYFFLFAALKNELIPGPNHVSLVGTWTYQLARGQGHPFWSPLSGFYVSFVDWIGQDKWFVWSSIVAMIWMIFGFGKTAVTRSVGVIFLCFWLFLIRGSLVINFYFVPLVPLGAIALSVMFADIRKLRVLGPIVILGALVFWISGIKLTTWTSDETSPQVESVNWIKKNLPPKSIMVIDYSQFLDLRLSRFPGDPIFPLANWFWKVQLDPEIQEGVVHKDWQNIDYVIFTHEILHQIHDGAMPFLVPTVSYGIQLADWGPLSSGTYLNMAQKISTNGDWVKVYKILDRTEIILLDSWRAYAKNFISQDGQVNDPQTGLTTSEGQSYGLIRAYVEDDKQAFDANWTWSRNHLQFRLQDKLLSWEWKGDGKTGKQLDSASATDADIDTATILILAAQKWDKPEYLAQAQEIVNDIWRQEVVRLNDGRYYLLAGSWAGYGDEITVNPSYLSPAAFRLFSVVDKKHPWEQLASDSYLLLNKSTALRKAGLPPDWVQVNKKTGIVSQSKISGQSANFGYDAMRTFFRISQDAIWFQSDEAKNFLNSHQFLIDQWKEKGMIPAGIEVSGNSAVNFESNAFYGAFLPFFKVTAPEQYDSLKKKLMTDFKDGQWVESGNYYTQNWAWMGLALAEGKYSYEK